MWTTFALGVLFCSALVLLPGTLQLLSLGLSVPVSIAVAPVVSIAEFVAFGVAFGVVGVPVGWVHLFAGSMACCVLLAVLGKGRAATRGPSPVTLSVRLLALSLLVGVLACLLTYVRTLGSPEAFAQQFDNASHLNRIQTFLSTSRFSTIQASTSAQAPIRPMSDFVFYPSGWHVLAAMTSDAVGCSPAMSENVANSVILAVVWPMSVALFADELFPHDRAAAVGAALLSFASPAFPWGFIVSGPLYANFAGYALLPVDFVLARKLIYLEGSRPRGGVVFALMAGLASLAALQPNAVFVLVIAVVPHAIVRLRRLRLRKGASARSANATCAAAALVFVACWVGGLFVPGLSAVAGNHWYPYLPSDWLQALRDCLLMGFRNAPDQWPLAILVAMGAVASLRMKRLRPCLPPLVYFVFAYVCNATMWYDDFVPRILLGYWYNDIDRAAACVALFALPFAALGASCAFRLLKRSLPMCAAALPSALLVMACYAPSFDAPGLGHVETALGARESRLAELSSEDICLTSGEVGFLRRCRDEIGNAEVINNPFDGSAFGYGVAGLNVRYRSFWPACLDDKERADWDVTRWLNRICEFESVRKSANEIGDEYVLLLDSDESADPTYFKFTYSPVEWQGLTRISDRTPGFETVLEEGDMRLYRILLEQ